MNKALPKIDENWIIRFFISKQYRWFRHLSLIGFSCIVLYYSEPEYKEPTETYSRMVIFFQVLLLAYSNMYFWVPRLLFKNRYAAYGLSTAFGIAVWLLIHSVASRLFEKDLLPYEKDEVNFLSFSFIVLVLTIASAAVKLFQRWMSDTQLIYELQQAKTNAELEQLKNQINPHFLFNMLNNANVLTKKDPDKASQVLLKLSDLLRYQLYDSARDKVFLTADIHFLEDFLNLEKIRRDRFDFMISKEGDLSGVQIPPLMFISFVENAAKHNNDSAKPSFVNLYFSVNGNTLFFRCLNSKPLVKAVNNGSGGLGLANIKRRLALLFPGAHELEIIDEPETYCVTLTLKL